MKKLLLATSLFVSGLAISQTKPKPIQITAAQNDAANKLVRSHIEFDKTINELLVKLNAYRIANGLNALVLDTNLQNAAEYQATDMAVNSYVGHINTVDSMKFMKQRVKYFTKQFKQAGEICASTSIWVCSLDSMSFSDAILSQYKRSAPHNQIMLTSNFTKVGISVIRTSSNEWMYSCLTFTN
jgi:uncharacterized protein YkwD